MKAGCVSPELPCTLHLGAPSPSQLSATDGNTNHCIRYHFFQEAYPDFHHEVGGAPVSRECCSCLHHKAHGVLRVSEGAGNSMGVPVPPARPAPAHRAAQHRGCRVLPASCAQRAHVLECSLSCAAGAGPLAPADGQRQPSQPCRAFPPRGFSAWRVGPVQAE